MTAGAPARLTEGMIEARAEAAAYIADQYATGKSEGIAWGEQDTREGESRDYWLDYFRGDYETATTRGERARMLGVLRGYREVVRTQLGGRWGS